MDRTKLIILVAAGSAVVAFGVYLYLRRQDSKKNFVLLEKEAPKPQPEPLDKKQPVLVLLYADWCPHCKNVISKWGVIQNELLGKVNAVAIESKDPKLRNFQFQGFPTIRLYPQGLESNNFIEYAGQREPAEIVNFALSN